jgi:eukaryotic-like serine/threonine-protein kinase
MAARLVPRVDIGTLRHVADLGRGGQGKVTAVRGFVVEGQWNAALKTYSRDALAEVNTRILEELVDLPRQLDPDDSRWLLQNTAWPAALAEENGVVRGFLMRTVPLRYHFDFHTKTQGAEQKLAELAFLLNPDSYVSDSGLSVSDWHRLMLMKDLAKTLSRLHAWGVIFGDFSPKNVLFSLQQEAPNCFLIDCDTVQINGESVTRQVETPDWEVPAGEQMASTATDAYKLGLLAIRLFARDQSARDPAALTALSPELGRLAEHSQLRDPWQRPAPEDWIAPLDSAATSASTRRVAPGRADHAATSTARISVPLPPVHPVTPSTQSKTAAPVTPVPATPRGRRGPIILASLALLVLVIVIVGVTKIHGGTSSATGSPGSAAAPTPQNAASASTLRTRVGLVKIGSNAVSDPRAAAVAKIFNTYFTGINRHHYGKALSVFDPNGQMNPHDSNVVQNFAQGDATTKDSHVVLSSIGPGGAGRVKRAEVTFQSQQAVGDGPADDPNETCTLWDITYSLVRSSSGKYLIHKVRAASDSGC